MYRLHCAECLMPVVLGGPKLPFVLGFCAIQGFWMRFGLGCRRPDCQLKNRRGRLLERDVLVE